MIDLFYRIMASDSGADGKRLLRKSSSSKMGLKEKIVQIYEIFFQVQIQFLCFEYDIL
jgi:hypothetical protein